MSPQSTIILALFIVANVAPVMMSPPMLRQVCGVVADAEEVVGNQALAVGKEAARIVMKPIAIVGGLKAAAVGTGMKIGGGAIKFVGAKLAKDGAILEATGAGVKGAGLGVAALSLKPAAEKIVATGQTAENTLESVKAASSNLMKKAGETSIQIGATLDSPILGHHHKEVDITSDGGIKRGFNGGQQQVEQQVEEVKSSVQQTAQSASAEAHTVSKRAAPKLDPEVAKAAMNLVKEAKLEDCVARAICDLNCDSQGFGQDGRTVFMNMVRLQGSKILDESDSKFYQNAAAKGRGLTGDCKQCSSIYSKCTSKSSDLIKMASHIRMD